MAAQTVHRQKRPFQPSITSFFGRIDRDEYDHSRAFTPQLPVLEPSIQSDLLSVGMRIRKAVPEGYKTHKTMLFHDSTPAFSNTPTYTPTRSSRTELLPFCGLHKVGGHSVQSLPVNSHEPIDNFADDRMPFSLSQESTTSTISMDSMPAAPILNPLTKHKRRYLDEEEDKDIPPFHLHFSDPLNPLLADLSVSPTRSGYMFSHTPMPDLSAISARAIVKPKSRRKAFATAPTTEVVVDAVEFEEASFLEPWHDEEIEMGGM
jgi:hypothetical protein